MNDGVVRRPTRRRAGCGCLSGLVSLVLSIALTVGLVFLLNPGLTLSDVRSLAERILDTITGDSEQLHTDAHDGESGSGGTAYTFAQTQSDGVSPVTWSCSGPIPVEVNPANAPQGYQAVLDSAIDRINEASGFTFEVVGQTDDRQFDSRGPGPVLVGFADEEEVPMLSGQTAGAGGATYVQRPGFPAEYVGGMVVLDTAVFTDSLSPARAEAIVIHELGHVLGLGHTEAEGELMRASISTQTDLGPGDRAGLQHLRDHACA